MTVAPDAYENRYYSKEIIDPIGLLNVSAYIHRNPIETTKPMVNAMELSVFFLSVLLS